MKVRFWGTRGSIACPGPDTIRYGGNTTCIQVQTDAGTTLIYDGGTGIRSLGNHLLKQGPVNANILITHTHWDHIQGIPFFVPIFIPGHTVTFYGPADPVYRKSLKELLAGQMDYAYFPVTESELKADIQYVHMEEGKTISIGDAKVTPVRMDHPVITFGYRIDADGTSVFFTGDHEPPHNIYSPGEPGYEEMQELLREKEQVLLKALDGLHTFIGDTMYTDEEYPQRIGWGHGTTTSNLDIARKIGADRLVFTHHDPERTDDQLDEINTNIQELRKEGDPEFVIAQEGMELTF